MGPGWKGEKPPGIRDVFRSSTQFSLTIFRTQLFDAKDMENVKKVQAGYRAQPLSTFLKQPAPPAAPAIAFPKFDKELVKTGFFGFLDFALQFAPPGPEEEAIRARLARIGIGAGKTFDFKDLSLEHKAAVALGMKEGERKVEAGGRQPGQGRERLEGRLRLRRSGLLQRRLAAARGGGEARHLRKRRRRGDVPDDPVDAEGEPLDGSKHDYAITFAPGQLPR